MRNNLLNKLEKLDFISKESLGFLEKNGNTLNLNLKYWVKTGKIIPLKRGWYLLKEKWDKENDKENYLEYLANKLYEPSYLSGEYVMSKYSLLTEAVFNYSCITTKKTKIFNNSLGRFNYYSLNEKLFTGYEIKKSGSRNILIASKEKAVFDFLYLRFIKNASIDKKAVEELRINWENIRTGEFKKIKAYGLKSGRKRIKNLIKLIERLYYAN